ncbi:unnamed protein product [Cylicocyclus nassatus]|uniref:Uncharacterized protein n=1 Tax=Cylicocyclus nassatus TaxID=53992 RepID=A0AA36M022_CYLNA|nr:unnamed protein product [Cylicocyclus nassatus]
MRIFKLTFLLLTILVILSAVDVGECGFFDFLKKIGRGIKNVFKKIGKGAKVVVEGGMKVGEIAGKLAPIVGAA